MKPTIGRIVHYKPTESQINDMGFNYLTKQSSNKVTVLPAIIVNVWSDLVVNLQVFIDGDQGTMWVTSAAIGDEPGNWNWPVKE